MAARRPLIIDANNRTSELPSGDTVVGVPIYLPLGLRTGDTAALPLSSDYKLTIALRSGGMATIQVVLS